MHDTLALLVPCYNAAPYIDDFLASLANLSIPFDEVIFYDDASTDNAVSLLLEKKQKVICGNINKGAAYARNKLIHACTSNWIHFHDIDDDFSPNIVQVFKENISKHANTDAFISNMLVLDRKTRSKLGEVVYDEKSIQKNPISYFLEHTGYAIIGCYKKNTLIKIGGFNSKLRGNEDPDLHIRLAISSINFKVINSFLSINLINKKSFSNSNWNQCMRDKLYSYFTYRKQLSKVELEIIGNGAIRLSNYFYRERLIKDSNRALILAIKTNPKANISKWANLIIDNLGVKTYINLYRIRLKIKRILWSQS